MPKRYKIKNLDKLVTRIAAEESGEEFGHLTQKGELFPEIGK